MLTEKKNDITYILFMGVLMAFLGWTTESIVGVISTGYIDSHGYFLPFIPSYSLVIFVWYFILTKYPQLIDYKEENTKNIILYNIILLLIFSLIVFLIEIIYGNLMEILFSVKLWNYNNIPMHITRYASTPTALGFGLGTFILTKFIFPPVLNFLRNNIDPHKLKIISIIIWSLILLDLITYYIHITNYHEVPIRWRIKS